MIVTGKPTDTPGDSRIRFRIYGGSSRLVTVEDLPPLPERTQLIAYPNPVHAGRTIQLLLPSDRSTEGDIVVHDALGRELRRLAVTVQARANSWPLPVEGLRPGIYMIVFRSESASSYTSLLVL